MSRPASPIALPWRGSWVPHAVLDLGRGCNIRCRACYNFTQGSWKPLRQLEEELGALLRLRRLHTVSLLGGEPTLHPDLPSIVRLVRGRGLRAVVISNGLELRGALLDRLAEAGTDLVLLHIDQGQERPDLPPEAKAEDVVALGARLAAEIDGRGMAAGMAVTLYRRNLPELPRLVEEVLAVPDLTYCLFTCCRDYAPFGMLEGSLSAGFRQVRPGAAAGLATDQVVLSDVAQVLPSRFGAVPLAFLPSTTDPKQCRWISYTIAALLSDGGPVRLFPLQPTLFERLIFSALRLLYGRYLFFHRDSAWSLRVRVLVNAGLSGRFREGLDFVCASRGAAARLTAKHLVFQESPRLEADGSVSFCRDCPDATIRDGVLVPVCLADRMVTSKGGCDAQDAAVG